MKFIKKLIEIYIKLIFLPFYLIYLIFTLFIKKENTYTNYTDNNLEKQNYIDNNLEKPCTRANYVDNNLQKQNTYSNYIDNAENTNYNIYYKPKRYVITLNELKFYDILLEISKELDLMLFTQVSLYNIIEMNNNLSYSERQTYFNKIANKSIDFVLADKKDCRIKLCIELDDTTHKKKKRIERDNFINKLFQDLEINLLRYPVYEQYYKTTLKSKIQENLKDHYYKL